jgi:hypothetical protein
VKTQLSGFEPEGRESELKGIEKAFGVTSSSAKTVTSCTLQYFCVSNTTTQQFSRRRRVRPAIKGFGLPALVPTQGLGNSRHKLRKLSCIT